MGVTLPKLEDSADGAAPRIPQRYSSIIALTYWIAEQYPERVEKIPVSCERTGKMASRTWTDEEVWDILRECICDALGVKPEEVTPDARHGGRLGDELRGDADGLWLRRSLWLIKSRHLRPVLEVPDDEGR